MRHAWLMVARMTSERGHFFAALFAADGTIIGYQFGDDDLTVRALIGLLAEREQLVIIDEILGDPAGMISGEMS